MGRSDYSVETSTLADESTFESSLRDRDDTTAHTRDDDRTMEGASESLASSELPRYATHKASRQAQAAGHGASGRVVASGLNRRLKTEFIDVDPADDSCLASLIRGIVGLVGACLAPRQILVALRLLKAVTVAFLALTAAASIVYVACVEFVADGDGNRYFGHRRDTVLRLYGLLGAVLALLIELDKFVMKHFKVLKGFLARFGLLFFVASVSYCHPQQPELSGAYGDGYNSRGVPGSAVIFQMVSSVVLACCSFAYLLFGLLCFDRFTSRAFLSTADPAASTAIPAGGGGKGGKKKTYDAPRML